MVGFLALAGKASLKVGLIATLAEKIRKPVKKLVNNVVDLPGKNEQNTLSVDQHPVLVVNLVTMERNQNQGEKDNENKNY